MKKILWQQKKILWASGRMRQAEKNLHDQFFFRFLASRLGNEFCFHLSRLSGVEIAAASFNDLELGIGGSRYKTASVTGTGGLSVISCLAFVLRSSLREDLGSNIHNTGLFYS